MYYINKPFGIGFVLFLFAYQKICWCEQDTTCSFRPLGAKTDPLPADNRFVLEIVDCGEYYIPNTTYKVRLYSRNNVSTFIAFTIAVSGDIKKNTDNPRKPIPLETGKLEPFENDTKNNAQMKENCKNTICQSDITPKKKVEVAWTSPLKENKCVTLYAFVAIKQDLWYSSDGPLSKRVCEDRRKYEDMLPKVNDDNCRVCGEARYQLNFQGTWSYNTHPEMFPKAIELARFSDVVGASHNKDFTLYKFNSEAEPGLRTLAEQGNSTQLESEILKQLGSNVRTVIKATGPPLPNMTTIASFRVSSEKHLISLVTALLPSPDWFLGVANLELCDASSGYWAPQVRLNLYPLDAGTDKGTTFESSNEVENPFKPISDAQIAKNIPKEDVKPFAKIQLNLIRTYDSTICSSTIAVPSISGGDNNAGVVEPDQPTTPMPSYELLPRDPNIDDCSVTTWGEWGPCEGDCDNDGNRVGFQTRFRNYIVNGVVIGTNFDNDSEESIEIPEDCVKYPEHDSKPCNEVCQVTTTEAPEGSEVAQRRISSSAIRPGQNWGLKK